MLPEFGWTELLMIGIVLIVVVGPKDLPRVIKGFGKGLKSVRRMSADFQKQFSDAMDEAEMTELRDMARDVRQLDPRSQIKDALNPLSKVGNEISSDLKSAVDGIDVKVPDSKLAKPDSGVDAALSAAGAKAKAAQPVKTGATGSKALDQATGAAKSAAKPKTTSKPKAPAKPKTAAAEPAKPKTAAKPKAAAVPKATASKTAAAKKLAAKAKTAAGKTTASKTAASKTPARPKSTAKSAAAKTGDAT